VFSLELIKNECFCFSVTVPEGGVKQGDQFSAPIPVLAQGQHVMSVTNDTAADDRWASHGHWKYGLCNFWSICCKGLCWMAFCCTPVVEAQIMTRMNLDFIGRPGSPSQVSRTFAIVVGAYVVALGLSIPFPLTQVFFAFYACLIGTRLRGAVRKRYHIPGACCTGCRGCVDDCCCMLWCPWLSTIQMQRHTHNEKIFPYQCCTPTGLPLCAPEIV
jgi:Cys-rich protein (TIGR01571 family)